jgi:hypothetical protein
MAVPRPLLLALLGTVLLAVTFMATISSREQASEKVASPALEQQPAPTQPQPQQATLSAADAAKAIFAPGKPIDSARFDVRFNGQELGGRHQRQAIRLTGAFQAGHAGELPSFNVKDSEVENGKAQHSRVLSTGDKGFLFGGATGYALPSSSFRGVSGFRGAVAKGPGTQTAQAPALDPSVWLGHLKSEGTDKLDGVRTTHISATIDPKRAATDVRRLVKSVRTTTQQPVKLPAHLGAKVKRALRTARLDAYVGTEDRILRRLSLDVRGSFPREMLDKGDTARWRMGLDVKLSEVNRPQRISAPDETSSRRPARALGAKKAKNDTGLFVLAGLYLDPPANLVQTTVGLMQTSQKIDAVRKPRAVARAVARHERVVIFFHQKNGLDDAVTDDAVAALRRRSSATVFEDSVANVASYGEVVMSVGVTRAPSIVIIGKSGRARLIEGYIDSGALAQEVADTR